MAIQYIPQTASAATSGSLIITGLSTDIKPTPQAGWAFFEVDTGILFLNNAGVWERKTIQSGYAISVQALTSGPADAATVYFGQLPKAPVTAAATSKVFIRKPGTITAANIYCYSGTAGTAEAWSCYIRKNNTTDTLIQTVSAATNERVFNNTALSIAMAAGDYFEIKLINPTWATNPLTTIFGGYIFIQ